MITNNVEPGDFSPLVEFAARAFVEDILGTDFFEYLLLKYNNETLTPDEVALVKKMQMAIAWRVSAQACLSLTYQLKNNGLQKQSGDDSEAVDLNEATFMHKHYTQEAILYEAKLKEYLCENKDLYPEYIDNINSRCCKRGGGDNYAEGVGIIII